MGFASRITQATSRAQCHTGKPARMGGRSTGFIGNQAELRRLRAASRGSLPLLGSELPHVARQARGEHILQRQSDADANPSAAGGGCRKKTTVVCPGGPDKYATIEPLSPMHLVNVGTCLLWIKGVDASGGIIDRDVQGFLLYPGDAVDYTPPSGSVWVAVNCDAACNGYGAIEHPYSCA